MSETKQDSCIGQIKIADEVIAIIAGTAASEIKGVVLMSGNITNDWVEKLGKRNLAKGVKVFVDEEEVIIDINLLIRPDYKVKAVATEVQERVKTSVETMTGLTVSEVNISVVGMHQEKLKHIAEA